MIFHNPVTSYSPNDYNQLLGLFLDRISIDIIVFTSKDTTDLLKKAIEQGHLQESKVDGGHRVLLFLTKSGREYCLSTK